MSTPKVYQRHGARQHGQITVRLSSASTSIARPRAPKLQAHRRWRAPRISDRHRLVAGALRTATYT